MSKLSADVVEEAVAEILQYSLEEKPRKFVETVELQIGLKNYDPAKDKRFSGSLVLPNNCKRQLKVCVLGDQVHCDEAEKLGLPHLSVEEMKGYKKNKKRVKKLAAQYDAFLASETLLRQIPRLLGPGLNKAGKFPSVIRHGDDIAAKIEELKNTVKFQLKRVICLHCAIGDVKMTPEELQVNITLACNFLASMLKKHWQNVRSIHIKSTMGPVKRIF